MSQYDVIIVGAGLSGLMAGLNLQKYRKKVLIIEKRSVAGGLCGTKAIEGYEFSMACNDFGTGFKRELENVGVKHNFLKANTIFYFDHSIYRIPANFSTLLKLIPMAKDLYKFIKGLKNNSYIYLEELLEDKIKSQKFKDTVSMLAYALAMPPADVRVQAIKEGFSKEFNYGYDKPVVPEGGPKCLIDAMVRKFKESGGIIKYEEEFIQAENQDEFKKIITSKGTYLSNYLITSQPKWNEYPKELKETLPICIIYLAVKSRFKFPENTTTIAYLPKNVSGWMNDIDNGKLPDEFGFHITKSDLIRKSDHFTLNISFLSPRGFDTWDEKEKNKAMSYIFAKAETLLPGIYQSILFKKFVSPTDFKFIYNLSSQNFKYVLKDGFTKPDIYDKENDIYHIGNSVNPPGEHAGGAILSAIIASNEIITKE